MVSLTLLLLSPRRKKGKKKGKESLGASPHCSWCVSRLEELNPPRWIYTPRDVLVFTSQNCHKFHGISCIKEKSMSLRNFANSGANEVQEVYGNLFFAFLPLCPPKSVVAFHQGITFVTSKLLCPTALCWGAASAASASDPQFWGVTFQGDHFQHHRAAREVSKSHLDPSPLHLHHTCPSHLRPCGIVSPETLQKGSRLISKNNFLSLNRVLSFLESHSDFSSPLTRQK